jgi:uncharacterized damage-inducible protein DinB
MPMLITPDYCRMMARYNTWQNDGLMALFDSVSDDVMRADRGAFFGSILGTLNHILWADQVWLHRLNGSEMPIGTIKDSPILTPTAAAWGALRYQTDGRITLWAELLSAVDLHGDLVWHSGAVGRNVTASMGKVVAHLFNHQTHHRGQVHAMLTAAGLSPQATDLFLLPDKD